MRIVNRLQRHSWYGRNASAFVDGELLPPEVRRFEAHLAGCGACASAVADAREWKALAGSLPEAALPRSFRLTPAMAAAAKPGPNAGRAAVPYLGLVVLVALQQLPPRQRAAPDQVDVNDLEAGLAYPVSAPPLIPRPEAPVRPPTWSADAGPGHFVDE